MTTDDGRRTTEVVTTHEATDGGEVNFTMKIELLKIPFPTSEVPLEPPTITVEEYDARMSALYERAGCDWVAVYGDREHSANLVYLSGYDPRFEEALLLIGPGERRSLIVGNEGLSYAALAGGRVESVLCQSMSLLGQPRSTAPRLADVLRGMGLSRGHRVGMVGWKYLEAFECDEPGRPAYVPAHMVDAARSLVGSDGAVVDATPVMMHPERGLRAVMNSAAQIAAFEWSAMRAAAAVFRIVQGARPGMPGYQAAALAKYEGDPLSAHVMLVSGKGEIVGLCSPSGKPLEYGDGVTTAVSLWGSLSCRAGMLLGQPDADFFDKVVAPYFAAVATWWRTMRIGVTGGEVFDVVTSAFGSAPFNSALNPGHLVSFDEWVHTPIRPGSQEKIASGMVFQSDIIPSPLPPGQALNCEDTCAIADGALRDELREAFPEVWARITCRREFMRDQLGIALADDVLPLSPAPAYLPPFWLCADLVCAAR